MLEARKRFWKLALFDGAIFDNIPLEDKTAFFNHICVQATQNSLSLHPRQVTMTQQVTKRAVSESFCHPSSNRSLLMSFVKTKFIGTSLTPLPSDADSAVK